MRITVPYGIHALETSIDWGINYASIEIGVVLSIPNAGNALASALIKPIGMTTSFMNDLRACDSVLIVVSDAYRRTAIDLLLPGLIEALRLGGIDDTSIRFLFASGIHRAPTPAQQRAILGAAVFDRFEPRVFTHDPYDDSRHVFVGMTSRGTPVEINRLALESDRVIATGTVVLHYFGGFGGGRKSILPGIASARTIAHNHAMNLHPTENRLDAAVRIGAMDGNPVAEDMLEGAKLVPVHGIVNTVLNRSGEIAGLFVGEMEAAHRAAAEFAHSLYAVPIRERADIVIASAGVARNYVQSHKALYNAYQAVKPDGQIIFLAPCEEGLGGEHIEKWLRLGNCDAIIAALRANSEIYGQTALSTLEKMGNTIMVTELSESDVALLGARKATSLENALELARAQAVDTATIYTMPSASYTVPQLQAG